MKYIILFMSAIIVLVACNNRIVPSTTPSINKEIINEHGDTTLLGHCNISMLYKKPYSTWHNKNYESYKVDSATVHFLKPLLKNKTMEIFLGSWCGDTKREVPRMLKILQVAEMDTNSIKLVFVDNATKAYKQSPQGEQKNKNIHHVPTFILYDAKEIGRIVETPLESFEKDLITILSRVVYTPKYKALEYWNKKVTYKKREITDELLQNIATIVKPITKHNGEFNAYGYTQLANKNYTEAINVFKLNCLLYPNNTNVFDSLAEAYFIMGNNEKAKEYYSKVLELDAKNENAKKMLEKIASM